METKFPGAVPTGRPVVVGRRDAKSLPGTSSATQDNLRNLGQRGFRVWALEYNVGNALKDLVFIIGIQVLASGPRISSASPILVARHPVKSSAERGTES